jgi:DNA-binding transcriptional LysR family regulator
MKVFVKVAELRNFTKAAHHLQITVARASRAVSALESHLSTRLLNRTTRTVTLTPAGQRYLARCHKVFELLACAEEQIVIADAHVRARPSGALRIRVDAPAAEHIIVPCLLAFARRYPDVELELTIGADRIGKPVRERDIVLFEDDSNVAGMLATKSIGEVFSVACATPSRKTISAAYSRSAQNVATLNALFTFLTDGLQRATRASLATGKASHPHGVETQS